jgi:hypothetical protein
VPFICSSPLTDSEEPDNSIIELTDLANSRQCSLTAVFPQTATRSMSNAKKTDRTRCTYEKTMFNVRKKAISTHKFGVFQ